MNKREEIVKEIDRVKSYLNDLIQDVDTMDKAIMVLDPSADIPASQRIKLPSRLDSFKNDMARFILDQLRNADQPMTSLELAQIVIKERGITIESDKDLVKVRERVGWCLTRLKNKGSIQQAGWDGEYKRWVMVG